VAGKPNAMWAAAMAYCAVVAALPLMPFAEGRRHRHGTSEHSDRGLPGREPEQHPFTSEERASAAPFCAPSMRPAPKSAFVISHLDARGA
jgi:hypothetical protein